MKKYGLLVIILIVIVFAAYFMVKAPIARQQNSKGSVLLDSAEYA